MSAGPDLPPPAAPAPRLQQCPPVEALQIHGAPLVRPSGLTLDPVTVMLQDYGGGRGRLVVECYGRAWSCWWGNMGGKTLRDFIRGVDDGYLSNCLVWGVRSVITRQDVQSREDLYLLAIARAVKLAVAETEAGHV